MPKRVNQEERRQRIAEALLRVVSRDGLNEVSLRHVATEAGVTSGMVQHYFPTKDAMMQYAMGVASERYEKRITAELSRLGDDPEYVDVIRVLLAGLIPMSPDEADDARVALAFQAYAVNNPDAAQRLREGDRILTGHIGDLLASMGAGNPEPQLAATTLLAAAEGLAVATLSAGLPHDTALRALDANLALFIPDVSLPLGT
ncbi:TetR/AcrR family transcriptional regulator [Microbacterium sp.]|uniref:TetR/AcrR family transcriptional regulator n=1 Tax=Microbacterium sp. TaxID=51671 RepID=UPI003F6F7230